jgi:hypothetical protein
MDSAQVAGTVLATDHDRLFKELLTTFFAEFLDLFFPKLAKTLDRASIEFLAQEHFTNILEGEAYRVDIVAKARFRDSAAFFLIHVEHQSTAPASFPLRFFRYYSAIFERHGLPIYPIVIYSHDSPAKAQPDVYRVDFADGEVLRFHYRVVQLNRLSWRRFVNKPNPVASALMAKMKIAPRDRPKVKAECLRLMLTLRLDPARMRLIASFVDVYLNLSESEDRAFQRTLERANLKPTERESVMEYVTSWERRGIEKGIEQGIAKGIEQGIEQGLEKGRIEGVAVLREALLELLTSRFGPLDNALAARLGEIDTLDELRQLMKQALQVGSLQELALR